MSLNFLVVDDSRVMRSMIIKALKMTKVPVADVVEAENGQVGLDALRANWIDVALVDINMPVMNGEEMIGRVREDPELCDLKVVVVSTESSETRIARLKEMGAEFVSKPFRPEKLSQVIRDLTGVGDESNQDGDDPFDDSPDF